MKKTKNTQTSDKLVVRTQTIRFLGSSDLEKVAGGACTGTSCRPVSFS